MKIKIYTTGGSIDKVYSTRVSDFIVDEPQVGQVLQAANVTLEYDIESLLKKDSLELNDEDRHLIAEKVRSSDASHILITHGTDTMANTALEVLDIPGKVIVLTGAMQPAAFKETDAVFNIGFAIACLHTLPAGVYLAMNGKIFDPRHVQKNAALDRFEETK